MSKLEQAINKINKKSGSSLIMEKFDYSNIQKIPFPSPKLNWQLYGGLPLKRITEIAGEAGSGKTTTALGFVGQAQKMFPEKRALFIDAEYTLDLDWAEKLGVDTENLLLMRPDVTTSGEDVMDYIMELTSTEELSVIVLDSYPALTPSNQMSKSVSENTYAGLSLPFTKFCRDIIKLLQRYNTSLFITNQVREDMNNPFNQYRTPGGKAFQHYGALRLFSKKGSMLDSDNKEISRNAERPAGHLVNIKIVKTKVSKPNRPFSSYTLNFMEGIDVIQDTIDTAEKYDIIVRAGAWYRIIDPDTGEILQDSDGEEYKYQGKANLRQALKENEDVFQMVSDRVNEKILNPA